MDSPGHCSECGTVVTTTDGSCARCALAAALDGDEQAPAEAPPDPTAGGEPPDSRHPEQPGATLQPAQQIGLYEVVAALGAGGMGQVYRARHQRLDRAVALKVLPMELSQDAERRQRFLHEARTSSALNHPNIVTVHDLIEQDGTDVLVMELIEGGTVADLLESGRLPVDRAVDIARQTAEGLAAAHTAGIVHRDLKPSNLMLSGNPAKPVVKIVDFGLAKAYSVSPGGTDDERTLTQMTRVGTVLGTAPYMSPEQARGDVVGPASDLFSLGVVLYEMLAGRRPFVSGDVVELMHQICFVDPPPLDTGQRGVDELLRDLLLKEPAERSTACQGLAERLTVLQAGASPAEVRGPTRDPAEGDRRDFGSVPQIDQAPPSENTAWSAPGGVRRLAVAALLLAAVVVFAAWWWRAPPPPDQGGIEDTPTSADVDQITDISMIDDSMQLNELAQRLMAKRYLPGRLQRAQAALQRSLSFEESRAATHALLALVLSHQWENGGDDNLLVRAGSAADRAAELDPLLSLSQLAQSRVNTERGEYEAAARLLDEITTTDPENPRLPVAKARLAVRARAPEVAIAVLTSALKRDSADDWWLLLERGRLLYDEGDFDAAADSFAAVTEVAPRNPKGWSNLAAVRHQLGQVAGATEALQKSLELAPSLESYSNLGTLYFFQGLYARAADAYEKALELDGTWYRIWANYGDALRWSERADEARAAHERALFLLRNDRHESGIDTSREILLLAKTGQVDEAKRRLSQEDRPDAPYPLYRLAVAAEITGLRTEALELLSAALEAGFAATEIESDPELAQLRSDQRFVDLQMSRDAD